MQQSPDSSPSFKESDDNNSYYYCQKNSSQKKISIDVDYQHSFRTNEFKVSPQTQTQSTKQYNDADYERQFKKLQDFFTQQDDNFTPIISGEHIQYLKSLSIPEKRISLSIEAIVTFFAGVCHWIPKKEKYKWAELKQYIGHPEFMSLFTSDYIYQVLEDNYKNALMIHELNEEVSAFTEQNRISELLRKQLNSRQSVDQLSSISLNTTEDSQILQKELAGMINQQKKSPKVKTKPKNGVSQNKLDISTKKDLKITPKKKYQKAEKENQKPSQCKQLPKTSDKNLTDIIEQHKKVINQLQSQEQELRQRILEEAKQLAKLQENRKENLKNSKNISNRTKPIVQEQRNRSISQDKQINKNSEKKYLRKSEQELQEYEDQINLIKSKLYGSSSNNFSGHEPEVFKRAQNWLRDS